MFAGSQRDARHTDCVICCCVNAIASVACCAAVSFVFGLTGSIVMLQSVFGTVPTTNGSVDFGPTTMKGILGSAFCPFGSPPMMRKSSRICVQPPRENEPPVPPPGWKNQ